MKKQSSLHCDNGNLVFFKLAFLYFVFLTVNSTHYKILPMTAFEPWISVIVINRSANRATTTALGKLVYLPNYLHKHSFKAIKRRNNLR